MEIGWEKINRSKTILVPKKKPRREKGAGREVSERRHSSGVIFTIPGTQHPVHELLKKSLLGLSNPLKTWGTEADALLFIRH